MTHDLIRSVASAIPSISRRTSRGSRRVIGFDSSCFGISPLLWLTAALSNHVVEVDVQCRSNSLQRFNPAQISAFDLSQGSLTDPDPRGKSFLCEPAILAPHANRAFTVENAVCKLSRNKLVITTRETALGCVIGLYVGRVLLIV
jgi:hypothetical protein